MVSTGKSLALVLVLIFIASLVIIQPATVKADSPKTIVVPDDYSDIQTAINHANKGDTVFVKSGLYSYYDITIDKPITLLGENSQDTIIEQVSWKYADTLIKVRSDNVTISGFNITLCEVGIELDRGTYGKGEPSGCKIVGNNISNTSFAGIMTRSYSSPYDVSTNNIITDNNITYSGVHGIYESSSNSEISNNYVAFSGWDGIIVDSCQNVTIRKNTIEANGELNYPEKSGGIMLRWTGPFYVYENEIISNTGFGIQFESNCSSSRVYGNNISYNQIGINLANVGNASFAGYGNKVYSNTMQNNKQEIIIDEGPADEVSFIGGINNSFSISILAVIFSAMIILIVAILSLHLLFRRHRKTAKMSDVR